ncbi:unnamed protein product [Leuciscus chuanchicus]
MFHVPKASFRVQRSGRRVPRLWLPPDPLGGEPTGGRSHVTPWGEARPPGAHMQSPTPGLAPGWGSSCTMPGNISTLACIIYSICVPVSGSRKSGLSLRVADTSAKRLGVVGVMEALSGLPCDNSLPTRGLA